MGGVVGGLEAVLPAAFDVLADSGDRDSTQGSAFTADFPSDGDVVSVGAPVPDGVDSAAVRAASASIKYQDASASRPDDPTILAALLPLLPCLPPVCPPPGRPSALPSLLLLAIKVLGAVTGQLGAFKAFGDGSGGGSSSDGVSESSPMLALQAVNAGPKAAGEAAVEFVRSCVREVWRHGDASREAAAATAAEVAAAAAAEDLALAGAATTVVEKGSPAASDTGAFVGVRAHGNESPSTALGGVADEPADASGGAMGDDDDDDWGEDDFQGAGDASVDASQAAPTDSPPATEWLEGGPSVEVEMKDLPAEEVAAAGGLEAAPPGTSDGGEGDEITDQGASSAAAVAVALEEKVEDSKTSSDTAADRGPNTLCLEDDSISAVVGDSETAESQSSGKVVSAESETKVDGGAAGGARATVEVSEDVSVAAGGDEPGGDSPAVAAEQEQAPRPLSSDSLDIRDFAAEACPVEPPASAADAAKGDLGDEIPISVAVVASPDDGAANVTGADAAEISEPQESPDDVAVSSELAPPAVNGSPQEGKPDVAAKAEWPPVENSLSLVRGAGRAVNQLLEDLLCRGGAAGRKGGTASRTGSTSAAAAIGVAAEAWGALALAVPQEAEGLAGPLRAALSSPVDRCSVAARKALLHAVSETVRAALQGEEDAARDADTVAARGAAATLLRLLAPHALAGLRLEVDQAAAVAGGRDVGGEEEPRESCLLEGVDFAQLALKVRRAFTGYGVGCYNTASAGLELEVYWSCFFFKRGDCGAGSIGACKSFPDLPRR